MGKFLMYLAFFIALVGMGLVIVETDFGTKSASFFTSSTYLVVFAVAIFVVGQILYRKEGRC